MGKNDAVGVLDQGFGPVFTAFAAGYPALDTDGGTGWDWAQVFHLHLAGHSGYALGAVGFAHGFVEQGGDDATVLVAGRAFVLVGDDGVRDDGSFGGF